MSEYTCQSCGEAYDLRPECEETGYCDLCAQALLADLMRDRARLDWLNDMERSNVKGTDFPIWSIEGTREDRRGDDKTSDQNIREAIDEAMNRE